MCVCGEGGGGGRGRPPFLKPKGPVMIDSSTALFRPTRKDFAQALNAFVHLSQENQNLISIQDMYNQHLLIERK